MIGNEFMFGFIAGALNVATIWFISLYVRGPADPDYYPHE